MNGAAWTDERIALLKKLLADGLSASQIAAALGGVTRNAVIGKAGRLGLSDTRPCRTRRTDTAQATPVRAPKQIAPLGLSVQKSRPVAVDAYHKTTLAIPAQPIERVAYGAGKVTFMQLERHHCRWPMDTNFCGDKAVDGKPYCEYHCGVAGRKYGT